MHLTTGVNFIKVGVWRWQCIPRSRPDTRFCRPVRLWWAGAVPDGFLPCGLAAVRATCSRGLTEHNHLPRTRLRRPPRRRRPGEVSSMVSLQPVFQERHGAELRRPCTEREPHRFSPLRNMCHDAQRLVLQGQWHCFAKFLLDSEYVRKTLPHLSPLCAHAQLTLSLSLSLSLSPLR